MARRAQTPLLKPVTSAADWVLLSLLTVQAATGVYMALFMRWGSQWYLHTAVPYLHSLLAFNPQIAFVADFPPVFKLHAAGAFLIVALLPFTKLVHLLYLPVAFLRDPPILYRWRAPKGGEQG
jgi:nitrate reductase gamma subunit